MNNNKFTVIALGGSIIVPRNIQVNYLKKLYKLLNEYIDNGHKFILVAGGGATARKYQEAVGSIIKIDDEDKDWLGIHSTRLNAQLMRAIFYKNAYPVVLDRPEKPIPKQDLQKYSLFIASGSRPGWSTDYIAFKLAYRFGVKNVLVATKIPYIYEKDITKHKDAKPIHELSWGSYKKLLPSQEWEPGMKLPIDPVATDFASKNQMECVLLRGTNFKNLRSYLDNKSFYGTIIK